MSMLVTHIYCGFQYFSHENTAVHKQWSSSSFSGTELPLVFEAFSTTSFHFPRSWMQVIQFLTFIWQMSCLTLSFHRYLGSHKKRVSILNTLQFSLAGYHFDHRNKCISKCLWMKNGKQLRITFIYIHNILKTCST